MIPARNAHLERMTAAAWNESPAIARSEQAKVLAELAGVLRAWLGQVLTSRGMTTHRKRLKCAELY